MAKKIACGRSLNRTLLDIRPLKVFATQKLSVGSHLREILLTEKDTIPVQEFLAKLGVWLKLLEIESSKNFHRAKVHHE
jgi:thiamine phosphate synthase YjbQ (UPF0047 family)